MKTLLASLVSLALLAPFSALAQDQNEPDFEELPPGYTPPPPGPSGEPEELPAEEGPASDMDYETFHEALSPYGTWNYTDDYGWVWTPSDVPQDWRPYSDGEWLWTSYGWTWSGSEPWAWAPYHYGRWCFVPSVGWGWVPGYTWGPAWVAWRVGAGYVGWTALYPGYPYGGAWLGTYPIYYSQWCFTGYGTFWGAPVYPTLYPTSYVQSTVWPHTHSVVPVQSGGAVYHGPSHSVVAAAVGHPITPVNIHPVASASQAGFHANANAMNVYAPRFHAAAHPFTSPRGGIAPSISASHPRGVGSLTRQGPVPPAGHAAAPMARSGVAPAHPAPPKNAPGAVQPYRGSAPAPSPAPRTNNGGGVGHGVSHPAPQSQRSPFPTGTFSTYHSDPTNAASGEPRSEPSYAAATSNQGASATYVSSTSGESRGPSGYGGQSTRTYSSNAYGGSSHPSYNTVRPSPAGGGSQPGGGFRGASHPSYGGGGSQPVSGGGASQPTLGHATATHPPSLAAGTSAQPSSSGGVTSVHAAPSGGAGGVFSAGGRH